MRAHSAFARSFRRKISAPRFYRRRNRVLDVDEISGASSGGAICRQGSGLQSIWHRHRQGDGLAERRHPQKEKRRAIPRLFRTGARTGNKTWRDVGADYLEPYRTSRHRLRRARSDVIWSGPGLDERPRQISPARASLFSNSGCYFLQQLALQHCLPLQQAFVCALTGDAAKHAARLAISRRYFIKSSFEFRYRTRPRRSERAEPSIRRTQLAAAEQAVVASALLRDHRSPKSCRSSLLPRQMHWRCRGQGAGRRPARYNTSHWLLRRG